MTRMESLIARNAELDRIHALLLAGETVTEPIILDQMWEDNTGCLAIIPGFPGKARKRYLGKAWCGGAIARTLKSSNHDIFQNCTHCHPKSS